MAIRPRGTPSFAHSLLVIPSFPAEMMLGMLPGISMPPDTRRPIRTAWIWTMSMAGLSSAAVSVALSNMAEIMLTQ